MYTNRYNSSPGNYNNRDYRDGGGGGGGVPYRHNNQRNNQNHNNHNSYNNHNRYNNNNNKHNNQHNNSHNNYNNSSGSILNNKDVAPRFKRNLIAPPPQDSVENLTFRPAANSLLFKANVNITALPLSHPPRTSSTSSAEMNNSNNSGGSPLLLAPIQTNTTKIPAAAQPINNLLNKDQILIKQASLEKPKQNKKDKGPNKEEVLKRVLTFLSDNFAATAENERNIDDIVASFLDLKVPDKFMRDTMTLILNEIVDKNELIHERVFEFLVCLRKGSSKFNTNAILDGFKSIINGMNESTIPRLATLVASLLCRAVTTKLCKLSDVATFTEHGQHYPLFLLVLQQLHKNVGKRPLIELFNNSKVILMNTLPEVDRTKNRMAEILEDRNLSFLYPLLKLQGELQKQIIADPNPNQLRKWIKDNVDAGCHNDPGFITALMTVLLKYITQVNRHFLLK